MCVYFSIAAVGTIESTNDNIFFWTFLAFPNQSDGEILQQSKVLSHEDLKNIAICRSGCKVVSTIAIRILKRFTRILHNFLWAGNEHIKFLWSYIHIVSLSYIILCFINLSSYFRVVYFLCPFQLYVELLH